MTSHVFSFDNQTEIIYVINVKGSIITICLPDLSTKTVQE